MAGLVAAGVGIYGALTSNDTASGVQLPPQFNMPNMQGAAQGAYQGIQNIPGAQMGAWAVPMAQQTAEQLYNNPGQQQFIQGANNASQVGQQQAANQYGYGNAVSQQGASLFPYAGQVMNTGFDPQNALYARTLQQVQDQTRAAQAARGVAMTPYGAGLEDQSTRNFNIDWQNAQLGRQAQAAQAATGLTGAGTSAIGAGQQMAAGAPGQYLQSAMMPYAAYSQIGQGQQGALQGALQTTGQGQQVSAYPAEEYLRYLQVGNQAGGVANQNAQLGLNQANMAFNQNQQLGQNLGRSLQGLSMNGSGGNPFSWMQQGQSQPGIGGYGGAQVGFGPNGQPLGNWGTG